MREERNHQMKESSDEREERNHQMRERERDHQMRSREDRLNEKMKDRDLAKVIGVGNLPPQISDRI